MRLSAIADLRFVVLLWMALSCSCSATAAEGPPIFQIDTGGHTATVRGLAFTPDGKSVISAGYDKVVRIWDLEGSKTVRTIRGQISAEREGEIYALALSPDGKTLAVAGYMSPDCPSDLCGSIRLFDFATGALRSVLTGHTNIVLGLAFSPDGSKLASVSSDKTIRLWDPASGSSLRQINGLDARASRVVFLADGKHIATVNDTAAVDVFDVTQGARTQRLAGRETFHSIAVSADGKWLAAGTATGAVHLWSWPSGQLKSVTRGDGARSSLLAFSDGTDARLISVSSNAPYQVRMWRPSTMAPLGEYTAHDNTVTALAISSDGQQIVTAGGSDWSVRVASVAEKKVTHTLVGGGRIVYSVGFIDEQPAKGDPFARIGWGYADPCPGVSSCPEKDGALQYALRLPGAGSDPLTKPEAWDPSGKRATIHQSIRSAAAGKLERSTGSDPERFPDLLLKGNDGQRRLSRRGRDLGEDQTSFTFDPAGLHVASAGRNGVIEIFDLGTGPAKRLTGHSADVWSIAFDSSGKRLVSGSADQTVRLWNADSAELIASLLYQQDGEWVVWTPQGYYAASPGGERAIGWHINKGPAAAAEYVRAAQLRTYFYQPGLVQRAVQLGSATEAESEARAKGLISQFRAEDVGQKRALPSFNVLSPRQNAKTRSGRASVVLTRPPENNVDEYVVYVRDTKIDVKAVPNLSTPDTLSFDVPLYGGKNTIRLVARSKDNLYTEQSIDVVQDGEGPLDRRDTLYIVAIGVDRYPNMNWCDGPNGSCDLEFAGADARAVEDALRKALGPSHQKVVSRVLYNGAGGQNEPTKENIEDALQLFSRGQENDTLVLFVAGHGDNRDQRQYLFLPTNAALGDDGFKASTVLNWIHFESAMHIGFGRKILFVDTCRSANAYGARVINDSAQNQVVVYTATRQQQDALELPKLKHGVFTYATLEGLSGKADRRGQKAIRVQEFGQYVKDRVLELTNGDQEPDYYKPLSTDDFVLARLP